MGTPSDAPATRPSLLTRLSDRHDQAAWAEFVRVYGPLVFRTCRRRLGEADADDVTQKVFVRVLSGLVGFRYAPDRGRFRDWLGTVVRNELNRHWRAGIGASRTFSPEILDEAKAAPPSDPEWAEAFTAHLLGAALEACQPRFEAETWTAFEATWQDDRPAAEVAARLDRPVEWVYVAKSRCLAAVTAEVQRLSEDGPTDGRRHANTS